MSYQTAIPQSRPTGLYMYSWCNDYGDTFVVVVKVKRATLK